MLQAMLHSLYLLKYFNSKVQIYFQEPKTKLVLTDSIRFIVDLIVVGLMSVNNSLKANGMLHGQTVHKPL